MMKGVENEVWAFTPAFSPNKYRVYIKFIAHTSQLHKFSDGLQWCIACLVWSVWNGKVELRARGRQFRYTDSRGREPTDLNESYLINLEQTFLAPSTNNGSTRLRGALPADFVVPNPATTTALTTPWTQVGLQVSSPTCLSRDHPKMMSRSIQAGLL